MNNYAELVSLLLFSPFLSLSLLHIHTITLYEHCPGRAAEQLRGAGLSAPGRAQTQAEDQRCQGKGLQSYYLLIKARQKNHIF